MSTCKHIDRICWAVLALVLVVTLLYVNGEALGLQVAARTMGYETRLFDASTVHTLDIVMDDWDSFLDSCENEEYETCAIVIDGEVYKNVGIRAKGNTSLSSVASYGNDRYSFKIEFDHYDSEKSYYGLDKLNLNNIIQDNTYMKDYLSYQLMRQFEVNSPLCSYVYITVNGEDWGLYLAVEGVEDSFLQRNYGNGYGELYKPDSTGSGGGGGNGMGFDEDHFMEEESGHFSSERGNASEFGLSAPTEFSPSSASGGKDFSQSAPSGESSLYGFSDERDFTFGDIPGNTESLSGKKGPADMSSGIAGNDVKLQYINDDPDSYSNIFDNAKTDVTDADKLRLIESLKMLSNGENMESVVDVEQVIRYFVVHTFVCNGDSYTGSMVHNYYLYEADGILSMIPWDYNLAFGGFDGSSDATSIVNSPIDSPVSGGFLEDRPMIAWIFSSEEYTELYHQYYAKFISTIFDSGYFDEMLGSVTKMIAPYVEKDPTKFCDYEEFQTGAATLKEFCLLRAKSVSGQLDGSIPSTSEEQSSNSSALIDASSISISDMGSMSLGNSMDSPEFPNLNQAQQQEDITGKINDHPQPPDTSPADMPQTPDHAQSDSSSSNSMGSSGWIPLGISAAILLAGLLFAYKFKQ